MSEVQRRADEAERDAHDEKARLRAYFPEGFLTVLAILSVIGAVGCAVAGLALAQENMLPVVVYLIATAIWLAIVRVFFTVLFDMREYLARLNRK